MCLGFGPCYGSVIVVRLCASWRLLGKCLQVTCVMVSHDGRRCILCSYLVFEVVLCAGLVGSRITERSIGFRLRVSIVLYTLIISLRYSKCEIDTRGHACISGEINFVDIPHYNSLSQHIHCTVEEFLVGK